MMDGVYLVLDPEQTICRAPSEVARAAVTGGVTAVQWRLKSDAWARFWPEMLAVQALCCEHAVPFLINDRVDVALAVEADGAHVGQDDIPAIAARRLLPGRVLGVSVTDPEQVQAALAAGADYLGVGPVFPTGSKPDAAQAMGLHGVAAIRELTPVPLVAIGGITAANVRAVRRAGASMVAVVSAICGQSDPEAAARTLANTFAVEPPT